jgi:hypothetical protein
MAAKRSHPGDDRNTHFEVGESRLQGTKPGFEEEEPGREEMGASDDSDQHARRAKKGELPTEPLARRLRSHR